MSEQIIAEYFDTMNAEKWELFTRLWTEDALVTAVGTRQRRGPAEITAFYSGLFTPWATHLDTPTKAFGSSDGAAAVTVTFTGRTHRGLDVAFDAVDIFEFRDDRICRLTNYYDLVLVRRLLETEPG